ncbi:MAG: hypothetical protein ACLFUG_13275 [Nitriliruptoraceae bacterium]
METFVITLVAVAVLGTLVAVTLVLLGRAQGWRRRDSLPPEEEHLDEEGTVTEVLDKERDR